MKTGLCTTCLFALLSLCHSVYAEKRDTLPSGSTVEKTLTRIAFGSCARQNKPQDILNIIVQTNPDLFIYMGDNIYADTNDPDLIKHNYDKLAEKPEFQELKRKTNIIATWDDHDYGQNDEGRHFELREESKEIFLEFWGEPKSSKRYQHEGIYADYLFGPKGQRVQILLLDTRSFRDDLKRAWFKRADHEANGKYWLKYKPHTKSSKTLLGKKQWRWLEQQLRKPADLRIIGTSIQFAATYNGYESWANFPFEQQKLIQLIKETKANGVIFISGDIHYSEISRYPTEDTYPIYDFTSSSLTQNWSFSVFNHNRIDKPVMDNNFGLLELDWQHRVIQFYIKDGKGKTRLQHTVKLNDLDFSASK